MSLGRELKALREKNGLTIEELSEKTHIGSHILEDLEAGDFGRIRAAIYGSGFVKILAKHYGIDGTRLRETFATEYQAWVVANAKAPAPKKVPQKFTDRRAGAKPVQEPPRRTTQTTQPTPATKAPAPAPAPVPTPRTAPTPATSAANQIATHSEPTPAVAPTAPDPLDVPAEEPLGGLFEGLEEPTPSPIPSPTPSPSPTPTPSPSPSPTPTPTPASAPTPTPAPAEKKKRKPRKPPIDTAAIRASLQSLAASVADVVRTPLFQRISLAALAVALSAWVCTLFIGGGSVAPEEPTGAETTNTEEAAPAAPVLLPSGNAGAVGAEAPPPDSAARRPRHSFTGSALTDNLLPPPDCYAE